MDISGDKYDLRVGHTTNPKVGYLDLTFQINSKAKETQKNNCQEIKLHSAFC